MIGLCQAPSKRLPWSRRTADRPHRRLTSATAAVITWRQLLAVIGGAWAVTAALVGVIYFGLRDDVRDVKSDIRVLQEQFNAATVASASVRDVVARVPVLEQGIRETREAVVRNADREDAIAAQISGLNGKVDGLTGRMDAMTTRQDALATQQQVMISRQKEAAKRQEVITAQVSGLAGKVDGLTDRVDAVATRQEAEAAQQQEMVARQQETANRQEAIAAQITGLDGKVDGLGGRIDMIATDPNALLKAVVSAPRPAPPQPQ
jgi:outer membrane murein-binding lipoprotein Lpp